MKSIKPGRGRSMMGGIGGIFMVLFGIVWTVMAARTSTEMMIFGALWTSFAALTAIYNIKNAVSKKRYSEYDVTDENEEPDPINERLGETDANFCPYCGTPVEDDYEFCHNCGKKLPK